MSIEQRPGAGVPRAQAFEHLVTNLSGAADPDALRALLRGPLHLVSPLRIGDLLLIVEPSNDDPARLDVKLQNARTMNPPVTIWTIP